jgi:PAS domain S-box-containing protein
MGGRWLRPAAYGFALAAALALALCAVSYLHSPDSTWSLSQAQDLPPLFLLAAAGVLVGILSGALNRSRRAARTLALTQSVILNSIGDAVIAADIRGIVTFINPAAAALTGWPRQDAVGRPLAEVFGVELPQDGGVLGEHAVLRTRGGAQTPVHGSSAPLRRDDGSLSGVVVVFRDEDEHRRTELRLATERRRLRTVIDTLPDLVWLKDPDGVYLFCNHMFERLYGAAEADIVGKNDYDFVEAGLADFFREHDRKAMEADGPRLNEEWVTFADDGRRAYLETIKTPMRSETGDVIGVLGIGRDITARVKAEADLREKDELLREMSAIAHIGAWGFDVATGKGSWTDEVARLHEVDPRDETSMSIGLGFFKGNWRRMIDIALAELIEQGKPYDLELELITARGNKKWVRTIGFPVMAGGRVVRVRGTIQDVTARKSAEEALFQSELRFRRMADTIGDVFWIAAPETRAVQYVSPAFERVWGYPCGEVLGNPLLWLQAVHPDDVPKVVDALEALARGRAYDLQYRIVRPDGDVRWVNDRGYALRDEAGAVVLMSGVASDITERKAVADELDRHRHHLEELVAARTAEVRAAEAKIRLILDSSADGLYGLDAEGRLTFINPAACAMLGYGPGDLVGRSPHAIIHHSRADGSPYPHHECPSHATLQDGLIRRTVNEVFWRADGSSFPVAYASHPMRRNGAIVGAVISFSDITARIETDRAREAALAEAQRLASLRRDFLANMSHEIRTPLNAVLGLAQAGQMESRGRRAHDLFRHILGAGRSLLGVVDGILDFSKIEAGKIQVECNPLVLGDVVDRAVGQVAGAAFAKGVDLRVAEAADLPVSLLGDALRLEQVMGNLLSNAVKFTPSGGMVALSVEYFGGQMTIAVSDTGIGMEEGQVARLFQPFEQADSSITRTYGGTGLGLSICRHLVELMGGSIQADSRPGHGSRFTVQVPLAAAGMPVVAAVRPVTLAGLSPDEAGTLADALRGRGCRVEIAGGPDPVTPDCVMPGSVVVVAAGLAATPAGAALLAGLEARRQRVLVAIDPGQCELPPALAEMAVIERPFRARHVLRDEKDVRPAVPPSGFGGRLAGLSVLAAEDNDMNRLVLDELLTREGARLVCKPDGRQALDAIRAEGAQAFHVVLTDIQMPEMDGYQLTRRLAELAPALPVIGVTAHAMPEEEARCLEAGMVARVTKPINAEDLIQTVLRHAVRDRAEKAAVSRFDRRGLEQRYPGKPDFVEKLLRTGQEFLAATIVQLRDAIARDDGEQLARLAHSVKGSAGNLMAETLHSQALAVEMAAKEGHVDAHALAGELLRSVEALLATIDAELR